MLTDNEEKIDQINWVLDRKAKKCLCCGKIYNMDEYPTGIKFIGYILDYCAECNKSARNLQLIRQQAEKYVRDMLAILDGSTEAGIRRIGTERFEKIVNDVLNTLPKGDRKMTENKEKEKPKATPTEGCTPNPNAPITKLEQEEGKVQFPRKSDDPKHPGE
jgi:hypothetical protein